MKKNIKTKKMFSENHVAVILEDIRSQFTAFGEGQSLLIDKMDNFKKDTENKFAMMGKAQNLLSAKLDNSIKETKDQFMAFGEGQEALTDKVDKIDEKLKDIGDNAVGVKHKSSEKVDFKVFQKFEKRFVKLEKIVLAKL